MSRRSWTKSRHKSRTTKVLLMQGTSSSRHRTAPPKLKYSDSRVCLSGQSERNAKQHVDTSRHCIGKLEMLQNMHSWKMTPAGLNRIEWEFHINTRWRSILSRKVALLSPLLDRSLVKSSLRRYQVGTSSKSNSPCLMR